MGLPLPPEFDLSGRTALITGAAGLLGRQHAVALAGIGARVIVSDIDFNRALQAVDVVRRELADAECEPLQLDVTSLQSVRERAEELSERFGAVDVLVNNAAIDPKVTSSPGVMHSSRFEVFGAQQWDLEIAVGLTGAMLCAQTFGTTMAARGRGVILNIASDLGVIAPDQRLYRRPDVASDDEQPVKPVTYSVIKHGLVGLTKYLATYWADKGVRVNALSPGGVYNRQDAGFVERLTNLIPMARMADPTDYRAVVQFLCSDASRYMTGQNIVVDGGRSVW
jgi:NAD(P)-dependent dehydrogenase (short-subunit alcohol dehydrogenase family)